jgi:uncharacterized protein
VSGLSIYLKSGRRVALKPVPLVSLGFVIGGPPGAILAKMCTDRELRWLFVAYLLLLAVVATAKKSKENQSIAQSESIPQGSFVPLLAIGIIAGVSSGLLGIGGGLAITALSVVFLHRGQHGAQALSLAITTLPLTLPAAWVYIREGWHLPWAIVFCLLAELIVGTRVGALFANKLSERNLRIAFAVQLIGPAIYMGAIANR